MGHALGNNYGKYYGFQSKPVALDLKFTVDNTQGTGTSNLDGQGIRNVFMHTTTTPSGGNPNPAAGIFQLQLAYNYSKVYLPAWNIQSPLTGSALAINGSALTAGQPYVVVAPGHGPAGTATIQPVADVSGSLAGTWFRLFDAYGNTFIIWFSVSGVGSAPTGVSGTLVQQSIATNDTAATIGADLVTTIQNLPSGISGVNSFTASGTTTVTVTSTNNLPLNGPPADGSAPTGFTFASGHTATNLFCWQQVGLMKGLAPTIGQAFIATAAGYNTLGGSTGTVKAVGVSGVMAMEIDGEPNTSIFPLPQGGSANTGGWITGQFLAPTVSGSAYDTPMIPTAPANGSVVKMQILLEQAAVVGGNNE